MATSGVNVPSGVTGAVLDELSRLRIRWTAVLDELSLFGQMCNLVETNCQRVATGHDPYYGAETRKNSSEFTFVTAERIPCIARFLKDCGKVDFCSPTPAPVGAIPPNDQS